MWRTAKRGRLIVMIAVSIAILFLAFRLSVTANGSQNSGQNNPGYVKYTLDLLNNTLINGNFVNTSNGMGPWGIAYDPSNGYIYVTDDDSGTVSVINGTTVIATIPVGTWPAGVAYDPSNGYIYVANSFSDTVSVINGTTVIATIPVGPAPMGVAYDPSNGYIYVTDSLSDTVSVINGTTVIANITVGIGPKGIAYDSSNGYIYVADFSSHSVSVIDGANNTVIATIPVGPNPVGVAYDPSNGYIYVTDYLSGTVYVIDGATNTVIATIPVGGSELAGVAYDPSNGYIYVANTGLSTVSVINGTTVIANITVGGVPMGVAYDPSNGYIYVADSYSDTVSVINGTTVIATIPVGLMPMGVAYDPSNGYIYVTNWNSGTVYVIDGANNTVIATITVGFCPVGVAYDPSNGYIYVTNACWDTVSVINGTTVIANITVGIGPKGIAYDSSNGYIYVTNSGSGTVSVINGTTVIANITVGDEPWGVAYDPSNGYIYVTNFASNTVSVIDGATNTVIATIPVGYGSEPAGVAYDPSNGYIYVANTGLSTVSVINGTTVIATIPVGPNPAGVAYDPSNGYIYVTNSGSGTVSVINGTTVIATIPVGLMPMGVAYDPSNGYIYVTNYASGTVSVISTSTQVTNTPPPPSSSSLTVLVYNVLGRPATTVPGVVLGVLYNSSGFSEVAYMNSSGYLNFNNISPGTYTLEVYHYPNTGLNLTEYWGGMTVNLQPGSNFVTFARHEPWIYNLQAVENGNRITINVTVYNPLNAILHGRLYIWVTTSPQTANPSEPTINASITIWLGLNKFTYYYTATQNGTYYIYAALLIYNRTQPITTDQWNWTAVMYQLTVIIINPYGASGTWQFKLYKSNNYFQQGQIVGTQSITFQQGQTNTMFSFDLTPGVYEYIIKTSELKYIVMPNIKGFINVTHNEVVYLYTIDITSPYSVLYLVPVGLSDTSQWYVVWNGTIILTPEENGKILLFVNSNETSTIDLEVYSTNPQYHPLLPIVQLNATSLSLIKAATYAVPFVARGYPAYIVDWNGVQWNPLLDEYSQFNPKYAYHTQTQNGFLWLLKELLGNVPGNIQIQDGFCWGMSSTAILYYLGTLPLPSQGASYTSQLYLGQINASGYLEYLTDASLAVAVHELFDPLSNTLIYKIYKAPANEIASTAIEYIDWNIPVILVINFTNQNGDSKYIGSGLHAVVAWGYVNETNGDVVFLVYDPNYPQIITRAIYYTNGSFIYIDGGPPYSVNVSGHEFSYPGDVGEVIAAVEPTPAYLSWFSPNKFKNITLQQVQILQGHLLDYTLYVSTKPLKVYTGGELVGYFINNTYFVTAPTVQPGELAGYVDGPQWSRLYIVAVRNGFNASVDPNSTLVVLRFANVSGTIMVYGFVVNSTGPVAVRFVNQSSFVMASPSSTVVKLELFSVTNSSVKTYNTTLWLSNGTGYVVNANFTNLTNATFKTVTVSWENITQTQTSTATTTTTNAVVVTEPTGSSSSSVPIWTVVVDAVAIVIIAISTTILIMSRRRR